MIIVADNLHVVNPRVAKAVAELSPDPIIDVVLDCQKAGAQAIDINSGPLTKSPEKHFSFLVETVQRVSDLPLILDTANPIALAAGLKICRNPPIINGFSLEPSKLDNILPLAAAYDVDIVGYLLGPNSEVPIEAEEMMATAVSVFEALLKAGLPPERLIIDPVIAPLSWDNGLRHNQAVLSVIQRLPDLLGTPVRTIAGISNLVTGPLPTRRKIELEKAFVPMLAATGLDMALLNVFHDATVQMVGTCNALLGKMVFAWPGKSGG
jgi:5-methyltetrahydrofolate corrinoid/iron sulfur protein methyltransferase